MASQMFGVTGNRRLKRNQTAEMRARLSMLPDILAAEQAAEQQRKDEAFRKKELAQEKKMAKEEQSWKREQSKRRFGLELGKTGLNLATSDFFKPGSGYAGTTIGKLGESAKGLFGIDTATPTATGPTYKKMTPMAASYGGKTGYIGGMTPQAAKGTGGGKISAAGGPGFGSKVGGFFKDIPIGSVFAGGLGGFGIGSMFGEQGGTKKMLYGGLAGAGLGLLSGGLSGALGGGLGGLFGGMLS